MFELLDADKIHDAFTRAEQARELADELQTKAVDVQRTSAQTRKEMQKTIQKARQIRAKRSPTK